MDTLLKTADAGSIALAASLLRDGEVVAIPTETVYGLAADATSNDAVAKIFIAKGRPQDNPLIVHIADFDALGEIVCDMPNSCKLLADAFWPGPLTMIMNKGAGVCDGVCGGLDTVAVRMPSHPVALQIIAASGKPLAAPSANISGRPSPTSAAHTAKDLNGLIPLVIDGGESEIGLESTVITLTGDTPTLLRPGFITKEQLCDVLGCEVAVSSAILDKLSDGEKASSPGMKYKHYSPSADVILLNGDFSQYRDYIMSNYQDGVFAMCYDEEQSLLNIPTVSCGSINSPAHQAHRLFSALRECDDAGAKTVYAHCPQKEGIYLAVYNRLIRAASYKIINL